MSEQLEETLPQVIYDLYQTFGRYISQIIDDDEEEEGDDAEEWALPTIQYILNCFVCGIVPDFRNDLIPVNSRLLLFENSGSMEVEEIIQISDSEDEITSTDDEMESESEEEEKKPVE